MLKISSIMKNLNCALRPLVIAVGLFVFTEILVPQSPWCAKHSLTSPGSNVYSRSWTLWLEKSNIILEEKFRSNCVLDQNMYKLGSLSDIVSMASHSSEDICRHWLRAFESIYRVTTETATITIPNAFQLRVKTWFPDNNTHIDLETQSMIKVTNLVIKESTIHNLLRASRPVSKPDIPQMSYIEKEFYKTVVNCDFCNYTRNTAEDIFGRLENKHAFSAANAFQLDKLHSMSVLRNHHPLNWTLEEFKDVFSIAALWFEKAYSLHTNYSYPVIYWDLLPKAGGSQFHPHIHMLLSKSNFPGYFEVWDDAAKVYEKRTLTNYHESIAFIHKCLGLSIKHRSSIAYASLTPKRDYEIIITSSSFGQDFIELLFFCMRALIEVFENYALSLAVRIPPMDNGSSDTDIPLYARLVSRGIASSSHSDVTSMELFTISSANVDPFNFMKMIKENILSRKAKTYNKN